MTTLCLADLDTQELHALGLLRCVTPQATQAVRMLALISGVTRPLPIPVVPAATTSLPSTTTPSSGFG
ncbi:MAG: hypothetical protein ACT4NL_12220 [Pseudomarimonas sp.]